MPPLEASSPSAVSLDATAAVDLRASVGLDNARQRIACTLL